MTLAAAGAAAVAIADMTRAGVALLAIAGLLLVLGWIGARDSAAHTDPPLIPDEPPHEAQPPEASALLRFARELSHPASLDALQTTLARNLIALLGVERVWVVARIAGRQHVIVPQPAAGDPANQARTVFGVEPAQWATFPLRVGAEPVGVLGVDITDGPLSEGTRRAIRESTPLIAHALLTAHTLDRLRESSMLDPLTGCSTRAHGLHRLALELKRAERTGKPVALLMVDIDHFKNINDRWGHNVGDAVLTSLGRTLMRTLRASDIRVRWGGEEFLIVVPEANVDQARRVAEGLLRRIADSPIETKAATIRVTASVGVTVARPGEHDIETLIGRADRAMYRAKAEGRSCVRFVLGDFQGAPIGAVPQAQAHAGPQPHATPQPNAPLPFRERRNPNRPDRRRVPGPGRRRTDPGVERQSAAAGTTPRPAADRAVPR